MTEGPMLMAVITCVAAVISALVDLINLIF